MPAGGLPLRHVSLKALSFLQRLLLQAPSLRIFARMSCSASTFSRFCFHVRTSNPEICIFAKPVRATAADRGNSDIGL